MNRVLVANRGEIARRVIRACHRLGLDAVAVYSDADAGALHTEDADLAAHIGGSEAAASYLDFDAVLDAARATGADAVHPGYGFLSERADFARAVQAAGLTWVGPTPDAIEAMGDKIAGRKLAHQLGIPVLGSPDGEPTDWHAAAQALGYPVLVKAAAGGGGRGMRVVESEVALDAAVERARDEAMRAFGDGTLLLEKFVARARHIEVQVLGDAHGNVVHLGERECSVQRRRQKVWEEAPAPNLSDAVRTALCGAAVALAEAVDYRSAGTVEFLVDGDDWWFIEMNTRIQVEHPVTEEVTGTDLVAWQLRVAMGEPLSGVTTAACGHSIEVRLCAEDPLRDYLPATGTLLAVDLPALPGVRIETGFRTGDAVSPHYDSLLAKIIATGPDRPTALRRLRRALDAAWVPGIPTNLSLLRDLCAHDDVRAGSVHTRWLEEDSGLPKPPPANLELGARIATAIAASHRTDPIVPSGFRLFGRATSQDTWAAGADEHTVAWVPAEDGVTVDGIAVQVLRDAVVVDGVRYPLRWLAYGERVRDRIEDGDVVYLHFGVGEAMVRLVPRLPPPAPAAAEPGTCAAPTPGTVRTVHVSVGDEVDAGDPLVTLEAMKMEQVLYAPEAGTVAAVRVAEGDAVSQGDVLVKIEEA